MVNPQDMRSIDQIREDARKRAKDIGFRGSAIDNFELGAFVPLVESLQASIVAMQNEIQAQHAWATASIPYTEDKEFCEGFAHACDVLATTAGVDL